MTWLIEAVFDWFWGQVVLSTYRRDGFWAGAFVLLAPLFVVAALIAALLLIVA
jgi:hypothetical protein